MSDLPEFRVYLSSTIEDLAEERREAIEIIRRHAVVKDSYRANEEGTVTTCTQDVREAHLYVGIIGQRYGWVPDGVDESDAKSITELEYEACQEAGRPRIPRLIFVRTTNPNRFTDALNRPETAERIKKFLDRAGREQQPYPFDTIDQFRVALSEAVMKKRDAFHREKAPGPIIFGSRKDWQSKLLPVVLLSIPGADDQLCDRIVSKRPELFTKAELSLTEAGFSWQLDQGLRKGQLCCFLVTHHSLKRIDEAHQLLRFTYGMNILRQRLGVASVLWVGDDTPKLPDEWQPVSVVSITSASLEKTPEVTVNEIYNDLRGQSTLTIEPRLALSCLVIAPTHEEVEALVNADGSGFSAYDDDDLRVRMRRQFKQLTDATLRIYPAWPEGTYGTNREDWRCFGPQSNTVADLIKDVVTTINTSSRGSRERELLQDAELAVRYYRLDEYLQDVEGSRRTIVAMRERGCLIVIDETALLHPKLRKAANVLLTSPRSAIVSISPYDPAQMPTRQMFEESSFLRVGAIVDRFKTEQDPQCEIALNSEERVQRWLRMAIPRLIIDSDGMMSRPRLIGQADQLLR